jgi:hypothetical protein
MQCNAMQGMYLYVYTYVDMHMYAYMHQDNEINHIGCYIVSGIPTLGMAADQRTLPEDLQDDWWEGQPSTRTTCDVTG